MRPPFASLALLASLLAGCGAEAPPPPPPAPAPAPAPAPEPEPPPPPTGRVLLVASEFGLSPLACFVATSKEFASGEACLPLVPAGAEVWLMSGTAARVTGRGAANCPGAATPDPTALVDTPPETLRGDAVAPVSLKDALVYLSPTMPADADRGAPKPLREQIAAAITAAVPELKAPKPRIDQHASVDLDGDGAGETIVAAVVPGSSKDEDANFRYSAIFVVPAGGAPQLLRGRADTRERYGLLGTIDLDGDGARELYLNTYGDDGFSLSLESRAPDGLKTLGRWSCG